MAAFLEWHIDDSVTPGYYQHRQATENAFRDGWLRTGDLAYMVDGELVVCGRLKDVIIVGGRNVFPEDIERAAGQVHGRGRGRAREPAAIVDHLLYIT